jgi:hypothetical protein
MRRSSWKEMVYGSGTRRTDQHHHRVSRFRMNWVIGLLGCLFWVACMSFRVVITLAWIRRAGCFMGLDLLYLMYGLGWVVTCGVWVGAYGGDCYRVY